MADKRLELHRVFLTDVAEMIAAREKCAILHGTSNIDAAGDEVEICVRNQIQARVGDFYHVGHGHVVDQKLQSSTQFDAVIADRLAVPSLFRAQNGTEYFPYESVYAVGEIKSTYKRSANPIAKHVDNMRKMQALTRESTPPTFFRTHGGGFDVGDSLKVGRHGAQNHLLSFMVFVSSGDFDLESTLAMYEATDISLLPNVVCLLDLGLMVYGEINRATMHYTTAVHPSSLSKRQRTDRVYRWGLSTFPDELAIAHNWAVFCTMVVEHLINTTLRPVSPLSYLQNTETRGRWFHSPFPDELAR